LRSGGARPNLDAMTRTFLGRLRRRLAPTLATVAALLATACTHAPQPIAVAPAAPAGPALWKVADEDTTIYLFGTVHALPAGKEWMRPAIADALAASDTLVTEVDLSEGSTAALQQAVILKGMLPQGQSLRAMLTDEQRAKYEAAVTRLGLKAETFDRFEPWYAAMMLTLLPLVKEGYGTDSGAEKVLGTSAGEAKRREALETVDYQLSIFDSLPQEAQVRYLMEVVEGNENIKAMLDKMVAEWLAGDADELAQLINEGLTDADLAERLLYQRNRNWADWIAERLKRPGTVFMAVGAGHLAGENSVQQALARRGIETARVP
jgi:uncharacterized protein YbaP (TraB family)